MSDTCFADTAVPGGMWKLADADLIVLVAGRDRRKASLARRELEQRRRIGTVRSVSLREALKAEREARDTRAPQILHVIAAPQVIATDAGYTHTAVEACALFVAGLLIGLLAGLGVAAFTFLAR